ncbi:MAG: hypothetical protein K8R69_03750 [Deltaproteobacteria bacterium]|nr:hypothetical protein [Deltaproteobacteria bacterium]
MAVIASLLGCAGGQGSPSVALGGGGNSLGGNNAVGVTMDSGVPAVPADNGDDLEFIEVSSKQESASAVSPGSDSVTVKISGVVKCAAADHSSRACPKDRVFRLVNLQGTRYVETRLGEATPEGNPFELSFDTQAGSVIKTYLLNRRSDYQAPELAVEKDCPKQGDCFSSADWITESAINKFKPLPEAYAPVPVAEPVELKDPAGDAPKFQF